MGKKQNNGNKRIFLSYTEKYEIMHKYLVENSELVTEIKARTEFAGYPIGQWQSNMRRKYYRGELDLDLELEEKLLELGILRKSKKRETADRLTWAEKYTIMKKYLKTGQSIKRDTVYKGYQIGQLQAVIRHLFYNDSLTTVSPELRKKFFESGILKKEKGIPLRPGAKKTSYDKKFEIMYQYLENNDFEEKIHQKTIFQNHPIGVWQDNLRQAYRKGKDLEISPKLMKKLFTYGILREEDKNKRRTRISKKSSESSSIHSSDEYTKEQLVEILLRKQRERAALDLEIAELQEKIGNKTNNEIEI